MTQKAFREFLPNGRTRLLGILGDPIEHSLSPEIHSAVLRKLDQNLLYVPVPVSSARLRAFLGLAAELGFRGCNVTTPFKESVLRSAEPRDVETRRTKMANTLTFVPGRKPMAEGTDGRGIVGWLEDHGLGDEPFGVLGFGATARSLVHASWRGGRPPALVVTRRAAPVKRLLSGWRVEPGRDRLRAVPPEVSTVEQVGEPGTLSGVVPKVWVSTWPPGTMPPAAFWSRLRPKSLVLDMNYGEGRTTMADAARREGHRAADGLGPLLQQAARSLSIWLDRPVEPELFRLAAGVPKRRLGPSR